jgi:hypothetical protein
MKKIIGFFMVILPLLAVAVYALYQVWISGIEGKIALLALSWLIIGCLLLKDKD